MATYESTVLSAAQAQTNTSSSSYAAVTWSVVVAAQIELQSVAMPIFTADTYTLSIDGVDLATSAATTDATFTLGTPKELAPGTYTFKIRGTANRRYRFRNSVNAATGTGMQYVAWGNWQEASGTTLVAATLNFKIATGTKSVDVAPFGQTAGLFSSQTWDITLATSITLTGFIGYFNTFDVPMTLRIDGVTIATSTVGIIPTSPVNLAPGTHQFNLTPPSSNRLIYATSNTRTGSSPGTVTDWTAWAENNASPVWVPGSLVFTDASAPVRSAALTGSGDFTATVQPVATAAASVAGTGDFSVTVDAAELGSVSVDLTGAGDFSADVTPVYAVPVALSGAGSLTATVAPVAVVQPTLVGSGAFTATAIDATSVIIPGTVQAATGTVVHGSFDTPRAAYMIVIDDILDTAPTEVQVMLSGFGALEDLVFTVDGELVDDGAVTDINGDLEETSIQVDRRFAAGTHAITATSDTHTASGVFFLTGSPTHLPTIPDPDPAPVPIEEAVDPSGIFRWVLQDLAPGGLGSWVMPINPTTMSNPHVRKTVGAAHTVGINGRSHLHEGMAPLDWQFSGFCPNQSFYDQLTAYADLKRRLYVIDHRNRAWLVAFTGLEMTPRKRHLDDHGVPNDWMHDYVATVALYSQTPIEVGP